ncbi:MAG: hypothetical protein J6J60_07720 [Clostridia bacterium]|nr:hypothetical protein [Clostridia bacterium]
MENETEEYTILQIINGGCPFRLLTFKSLQDAKNHLYSMIKTEELRQRAYYVDNDFFENKYPLGLKRMKYYCIQKRSVSNWEKCIENETIIKNTNNVIMFRKGS